MTLNEIDIDTLQAGREVDELVAEHVMGYQRGNTKHGAMPWYPPSSNVGRSGGRLSVDEFSTDIRSAWAVVEHVVAQLGYDRLDFDWRGPIFKPEHKYLTLDGYPLGTTCWYVEIEVGGTRYWVCADSAPLAVCRAALLKAQLEAQL